MRRPPVCPQDEIAHALLRPDVRDRTQQCLHVQRRSPRSSSAQPYATPALHEMSAVALSRLTRASAMRARPEIFAEEDDRSVLTALQIGFSLYSGGWSPAYTGKNLHPSWFVGRRDVPVSAHVRVAAVATADGVALGDPNPAPLHAMSLFSTTGFSFLALSPDRVDRDWRRPLKVPTTEYRRASDAAPTPRNRNRVESNDGRSCPCRVRRHHLYDRRGPAW